MFFVQTEKDIAGIGWGRVESLTAVCVSATSGAAVTA